MLAGGIVNFGTDLDNPSFAEVARAIGLHGVPGGFTLWATRTILSGRGDEVLEVARRTSGSSRSTSPAPSLTLVGSLRIPQFRYSHIIVTGSFNPGVCNGALQNGCHQ